MDRGTKTMLIAFAVCLASVVAVSKYDEGYYASLPAERKAHIARIMSEIEQAPPKSLIVENDGRMYYMVAPYAKGARCAYVKWYAAQTDTTEYVLMSYRQKARIDRIVMPGHPEHGSLLFRFFNGR